MSGSDKNYFDLILPKCWTLDRLAVVDRRSSPSRRHAVEQIARFFLREGRYDFLAYDADYPGETRAVLFAADYFNFALQNNAWVAACCFDRDGRDQLLPEWCLDWAWCHPYLRGGFTPFLPHVWPDLCGIIDELFFVCPPLSPAMHHALVNMGYRPNKRGFFLCGKDIPPAADAATHTRQQGIAPQDHSAERSA